jgi:hypothetical protein
VRKHRSPVADHHFPRRGYGDHPRGRDPARARISPLLRGIFFEDINHSTTEANMPDAGSLLKAARHSGSFTC